MLSLRRLTITQFKNYDYCSFAFKERIIGICGLNGRGKTNLLDAIYYLCFTKSYFTSADGDNMQFDKDGFRLEGSFNRNEKDHKLVCINRGTGKKEMLVDEAAYDKLSQHIGLFPCVMVAPDDIELIAGGSEQRRKFVDTVLSEMDTGYLQHLIVYNKVLLQRNSLLKRFTEQGKTDMSLLDVLNKQLLTPGIYIHTERKKFAQNLIPLVQEFYRQIAGNEENITLSYESKLNESSFENLLAQYQEKDLLLQRTNAGIHKDDIAMQLNGQVFRNFASQGQRKSLLFALKLAEFELLKIKKGFAPLLLLDDVFEKLDDLRMQHLLNWVCRANDCQVFITDTHRDRLESAFIELDTPYQVIEL